jgi:hypothetical protein
LQYYRKTWLREHTAHDVACMFNIDANLSPCFNSLHQIQKAHCTISAQIITIFAQPYNTFCK